MFNTINSMYASKKRSILEDAFIVESVLGDNAELDLESEDFDDFIDTESIPDDVYKKLDSALDKIVSDPNYDDTEVEEMADDDLGLNLGENRNIINTIIDEACDQWLF